MIPGIFQLAMRVLHYQLIFVLYYGMVRKRVFSFSEDGRYVLPSFQIPSQVLQPQNLLKLILMNAPTLPV